MSKKLPSKDEALEALDFIVNVLKEHEKDLDRLIGELGGIAEQLGNTGELTGKVENVEKKISGLQNEIGGLINYLSTAPHEAPVAAREQPKSEPAQPSMIQSSPVMQGPPVILRCKQWEDFQSLAFQPQTLSFMIKDAEKTFQAGENKT